MKMVSFVVPCFNEEDVVKHTIERLDSVVACLENLRFEFIFVDDGSSDRTLEVLREEAKRSANIRVVSFSRNFGHQLAVSAGVDEAKGDAVVLIDADLQDPPEIALDMIRLWQQGYDVVYGVRRSRSGESSFKLATARGFYRVLNWLSEVAIPLDTGDFRLMSREVVEVLKDMPEHHRFVRGMVAWIGFKQVALPYDRAERFAGVSKYPLRKMVHFAMDGILSFSTKPLQVSIAIGLFAATLSLVGILYALIMRVFTDTWVEGWTALMIAVLFIGGVQLLSLGILGEYVGRIYNETKRRPLYIVRERIVGGAGRTRTPAPTVAPAETEGEQE